MKVAGQRHDETGRVLLTTREQARGRLSLNAQQPKRLSYQLAPAPPPPKLPPP